MRDITEQKTSDEHGKKTRAVRERRERVHGYRQHEHKDGEQVLPCQSEALDSRDEREGTYGAAGESNAHLDREVLHDNEERRVVVRRQLNHPKHQSDTGRVVDSCLALKDRARAALELTAGENRENDRG